MKTDDDVEPTHEELIKCLASIALSATAKRADSMKASLLSWHRRFGHPSFKTEVELAKYGANGILITDLSLKIPSLDACAACCSKVGASHT
jgi:hypothetical protein